jgi:O-antigen/teichoic acid export membrane protein
MRMLSVLRTHRGLIQRFITLSLVNIGAAGVFFLTQTYIANRLGRAQFGLLAYGIALGLYGQILVGYGQERSLVRDLVHRPQHFAAIVMTSLRLRTGLFTLVGVGLLLWNWVAPTAANWGVIVICLAYMAKALDFQAVFDTQQAMGRHAVYTLLQRLVYAALIGGLSLGQIPLTLLLVGMSLLAAQSVNLLVQNAWICRQCALPSAVAVSWQAVVGQARDGVWLCLSLLLSLTLLSLTQILILHFAGPRELGGFAAAWQLAMIAVLLIQFAVRVGGPRLAQITQAGTDAGTQLRFLLAYAAITVGLVAPVVAIFLGAPAFVMGAIYSAEYHSEARILVPMGLYVLLLAPGVVCEQFLVSTQMEVAYLSAMVLSGLTSLCLGVAVIPSAGGYGAGWVLVVSYGVALGVYVWAISRHLHRVSRLAAPRAAHSAAGERAHGASCGHSPTGPR